MGIGMKLGTGKIHGKRMGIGKNYGDGAGMGRVYFTKSMTSLW